MAAKVRSWLFKKRTWAGVAVAVGVILGVNLPEFWKGFGGGGANPLGLGPSDVNTPVPSGAVTNKPTVSPVNLTKVSESERSASLSSVIKVVISERSLWLRSPEGDRPIEVVEVVELVKRATGDADGIRVRIYRNPSSRPSAEATLQSALTDAAIPDSAILWVPTTNN